MSVKNGVLNALIISSRLLRKLFEKLGPGPNKPSLDGLPLSLNGLLRIAEDDDDVVELELVNALLAPL